MIWESDGITREVIASFDFGEAEEAFSRFKDISDALSPVDGHDDSGTVEVHLWETPESFTVMLVHVRG